MEHLTDDIVVRAKALSVRSGLSLKAISKRLFGDIYRLRLLETGEGRSFPDTLERAESRLRALEESPPKRRKRKPLAPQQPDQGQADTS